MIYIPSHHKYSDYILNTFLIIFHTTLLLLLSLTFQHHKLYAVHLYMYNDHTHTVKYPQQIPYKCSFFSLLYRFCYNDNQSRSYLFLSDIPHIFIYNNHPYQIGNLILLNLTLLSSHFLHLHLYIF